MSSPILTSDDCTQRFLFERTDIRGEIITLADSYQQVRTNNAQAETELPESVMQLLGEFMAAVSLLAGTLKFEGTVTLQARGEGPMPMIMAESNNHQGLRAVAQVPDAAAVQALDEQVFSSLLGDKGLLAIIIQPEKGERYQGIVPLERSSLAGCLEDYFAQSEQLPTRFWLAVDAEKATGIMLQAMPQQLADAETNQEHWRTIEALAATIKDEELLSLNHETVLYRLFNEESVRLFDAQTVRFACSCSEERCVGTLESLGLDELERILSEQDLIVMDCHFCGQKYQFGPQQVAEMFSAGDETTH